MAVSEVVLGIEQRNLLKDVFNFVESENLTEIDDEYLSLYYVQIKIEKESLIY